MNPSDPLANLQPLREPELIGWWPLAPGWWLVVLLAAVALISIGVWLLRHLQRTAYRRAAIRQLDALRAQNQAETASDEYLSKINALLKSVAVIAYGKREVAAQHGDKWLAFLNRTGKPQTKFAPEFATAIYQQNAAKPDAEELHRNATQWIKYHKVAPRLTGSGND